jgi:ABC-type branched-subunit amino acid transport system permease subunit
MSRSGATLAPARALPQAGRREPLLARLRLDGPQTVFNGPVFWAIAVLVVLGFAIYPAMAGAFVASNLAAFLLNLPLALGLSLLWGYGGVLSFGQVAFFGIAAYTYGIVGINLGMGTLTLAAALAALAATGVVALAFGYFVFYGRVSSWIVPVLTLVLTLILETFLAQTAGYEWRVGDALLGGYNGMTGIPSLAIGTLEFNGFTLPLYYLVLALSLLVYLGLRVLVNSRFGYVAVAIREDPERTELLGYDIRLYRLALFVIAALLAGLSGILYASWGNYVSPSSVGLIAATLPVLWVAVGGKASLTAVVVSTVALVYLADALSVRSGEFAYVIMGALLLLAMMFSPEGILISLLRGWRRLRARRRT